MIEILSDSQEDVLAVEISGEPAQDEPGQLFDTEVERFDRRVDAWKWLRG